MRCALGGKLAADVLGCQLAQPAVNTNGVTKLRPAISRYIGLTRMHPVLCIADTDGACASALAEQWLPSRAPADFLLRFAVAESESWLLADRESLAEYLQVPEARMPSNPDDEVDAKRVLLNLARRSRKREIRAELVSQADPSKPGTGYNAHLSSYVSRYWQPREAVARSPSLGRAIRRLEALGKAASMITRSA